MDPNREHLNIPENISSTKNQTKHKFYYLVLLLSCIIVFLVLLAFNGLLFSGTSKILFILACIFIY